MATDYQFVGIKHTLAAFQSRGVEAWAIFAGKRLITRGCGVDELAAFLQMIAQSNTVAVYTIKVYEDIDDPKEIKSNTADDGSFNFKLFSLDGGGGSMSGIIGTHYGDPVQMEILERLKALEQPEEDQGIMSQITNAFIGMLQEPRKLHEFLGALNGTQPQQPQYYEPRTVGNVHRIGVTQPAPARPQATAAPLTSEQSLQRIGDAVETIGRHDEKVVEHLEMLAKMAETNTSKFKMLLSLLDAGL